MSFNTKTYDNGNHNYNTNFDTYINGNNTIALDGTKYYDSKFGKVMASLVVDNGDSIFGGNVIISNALTVYDNIMIGGQISLLNSYTLSFIANTYTNTSCLNLTTSSSGKYVSFCSLNKIYSSSDFGKTMSISLNSDSMSCVSMNSTGKYQVATSIYTSSTTNSNVYTSNDYGVTFILRSTITANKFGRFLEGSSVDETGQYIFLFGCGTFGLQNYYSKDFGVTFTQIPTNLNYGSSSCFVDRTKKVFYTSSNSSSMISSITLSDAILTETITNIPFVPSFVSC